MKFKIEDIQKEFENKKWQLLEDTYKNLDTEMSTICPEGHKVFVTYRKWRVYHECPICKANPLKRITDMVISPKPFGATRVLALDQATQISGWAIFDNKKLIQFGTFSAKESTSEERIETVRQWVASMNELWNPDRIAIEDIHMQSFGNKKNEYDNESVTTFKTLAHLQGVLINYFYTNDIKYDVIHSAKWREFCQIKGVHRADKKRSAQLKIKEWYDVSVTQDEADAICIGKYEAERNLKNNTLISWE